MKKPKMILFDYGQTLGNERKFDGISGTAAVLRYATENKYGYTAERVQAEAQAINDELGRYSSDGKNYMKTELPNHMFTSYLYESMGIELSLSPKEIDRVFWDAASPAVATDGIEDFLEYLKKKNIRTGVISNIPYCPELVEDRINNLLPNNNFEFIIATSRYMFRKPSRRIFQLALEKAGLSPEEVWYVGDNYICDVIGAREAGMFPVWYLGAVENRACEDGDTLIITHWHELSEFIEKCD